MLTDGPSRTSSDGRIGRWSGQSAGGWALVIALAVIIVVVERFDRHIITPIICLVVFGAATAAVASHRADMKRRALQTATKRLASLEQIAGIQAQARPLEESLQALMSNLRSALVADYIAVLLVEHNRLVVRAVEGAGDRSALRSKVRLGEGLVGRVAISAKTEIMYGTTPQKVAIPSFEPDIVTAAATALNGHEGVIGVLLAGHSADRRWDDNDVTVLEVAADRLATAVQTGRLGESQWRASLGAVRAREHLRMIGEASRILMRSLDDYEGPLAEVTTSVVSGFSTLAVTYLADEDRLRPVATRLGDQTTPLMLTDAELRPILDAMAAGRSQLGISRNFQRTDAPEWPLARAMLDRGIHSYAIAPILVRGQAFGALLFGTGEGVRGFRPADRAAIDELAARIALAIEASLLYREARSSAATTSRHLLRLSTLLDTKLAIATVLDHTTALQAAAEGAARVFPGARVVVALGEDQYDGGGMPLDPPLRAETINALSESQGMAFAVDPDDVVDDSGRAILLRHTLAAALAPVETRRGVVLVTSDELPFSDDDYSLLALLARMLSSSLVNAALTEQTQAVAARLEAIFTASPVAIITADPQLQLASWNPAAGQLFGRTEAGRGTELTLPEEISEAARMLAASDDAGRTASPRQTELTVTLGGEERNLTMMLAPVREGDRLGLEISGYVVAITEDTERRRLATQFQQAQRMEAVGRLAGGIAHDFNNLLTVILGYTDGLLRRLPEHDPVRDRIAAIHRAGTRGAEMTKQLLMVSRQQVVNPIVVRPAEVIDGVADMLRRLVGEGIEVLRPPGDDDAKVRVDLVQLEQVLLNVAANARDAMPDGGRLTIRVRRGTAPFAVPAAPEGSWVEIRMVDTGTGMDAATLAHCLDPLFTTKEPGAGTGLGLSAVYGIARQHDGDVRVQSSPGTGTTVSVILPEVVVAEAHALPETPIPTPTDHAATGSESVLVVDDDHEIRWMVWRLLRERGYRTMVADSPADALDLLRETDAPVDLLVTDVAMPGMTGPELSRAVQAIRRTPVLFTSGYAERLASVEGTDDPSIHFLAKPFTPDELVAKVQEALTDAVSAETA